MGLYRINRTLAFPNFIDLYYQSISLASSAFSRFFWFFMLFLSLSLSLLYLSICLVSHSVLIFSFSLRNDSFYDTFISFWTWYRYRYGTNQPQRLFLSHRSTTLLLYIYVHSFLSPPKYLLTPLYPSIQKPRCSLPLTLSRSTRQRVCIEMCSLW